MANCLDYKHIYRYKWLNFEIAHIALTIPCDLIHKEGHQSAPIQSWKIYRTCTCIFNPPQNNCRPCTYVCHQSHHQCSCRCPSYPFMRLSRILVASRVTYNSVELIYIRVASYTSSLTEIQFFTPLWEFLTHWGRVKNICTGNIGYHWFI